MKPLLSKLFRTAGKLGSLVLSKAAITRRAILKTEARERRASEAERLDRLCNPQDYRGR